MILSLIQSSASAASSIADLTAERIAAILRDVAQSLSDNASTVLEANREDLSRMDLADPRYDRLKLTHERLSDMARDMVNVASLPSPLHRTLSETTRPNGMTIRKVSVPFGLVGIIYESRPNVTLDVFALCLKSGNASLLKGGSDADCSNRALVSIIHGVLESHGLPAAVCTLLPPSREATAAMLGAVNIIDLIIPRGSASLIQYVRANSRVPVIETGAGICHTYFDASGDVVIGRNIVTNAKTRRVSVCNALDCLLIHASRLADLPQICRDLQSSNVIIYADERAYHAFEGNYPSDLLLPATPESFGTEFLDYKLAIRTVDTLDAALDHIAAHGSRHSECIVSSSDDAIRYFLARVDAACVYANVSTAFTDGGEFGFGAEIGISTQKLHARGPMALPELTTYKYIITGDGQIR